MARQGIRRTHTGCVTCKCVPRIRKVKCDETRPSCVRCSSTGRKCDGYQIWLPKGSRQMVQPSTIPNAGAKEYQSLDYYRKVVGLALPGPLPRAFWTRILPLLSHTELSVRHATIAITSLYGTVEEQAQGAVSAPQTRFALKSYNSAMNQVIKSHNLSHDVVGVACILFMVVEMMDPTEEGAYRSWLHYQHGLAFVRENKGYLNIRAIFRRLHLCGSFFYELFGMPPFDETLLPAPGGPFHDLVDVQESMDGLASRSYKVARAFGKERATDSSKITDEALLRQKALDLDLDTWYNTYQAFKLPQTHNILPYMALEARYLISKIWSDPRYYESPNTPEQARLNVAGAIDFVNAEEIPPVLLPMLESGQNLQVRLGALAMLDAKLKYGAHQGEVQRKWEALFMKTKEEIRKENGITLGASWAETDELENLTGIMLGQTFLDNVYVRTHFLYPWVIQVLNIIDRVGQFDLGS